MLKLTRCRQVKLLVCTGLALALPTAAPAAFADSGSSRSLSLGARGAQVRELQTALAHLGFSQPVTGWFGPMTAATVRAWERRAHQRVDGVVSPSELRQIRKGVGQGGGGSDDPNGGTTPSGTPIPVATPRGAPPVPVSSSGYVFPIRGAHSYGTTINRFGAPRSGHVHQGQDVLAASGTPLVAARGGVVSARSFQAAAGNYLVIQADDGTDHVYMHLLAPAIVAPGQRVKTGQQIGQVGQTGDATTPHLHFEVWTAHWYAGGHTVDPLPYLRAWDAVS